MPPAAAGNLMTQFKMSNLIASSAVTSVCACQSSQIAAACSSIVPRDLMVSERLKLHVQEHLSHMGPWKIQDFCPEAIGLAPKALLQSVYR